MRRTVTIFLGLLTVVSSGCQLAWKETAQERAPRRVEVDAAKPSADLVEQVKTGQFRPPSQQTISDYNRPPDRTDTPVQQPYEAPAPPLAEATDPTHRQVSYAATINQAPIKPRTFHSKSPHVELKGVTQSGNGDAIALLKVGERTVLARKGHRFSLQEDGVALELIVEEVSAEATVLLDPNTNRRWEAQ